MDKPAWVPSPERIAASNLTAFMAALGRDWGTRLDTYGDLHRYSLTAPEQFWRSVWDFCGVIASRRGDTVVTGIDRMPGARWFPEARLNLAENLLRRRDDADALVQLREDAPPRRVSFGELHDIVSRLRQALAHAGVRRGDRVAGFLPNGVEAVAAMTATVSLGAVWCACAPDFGVDAAADRLCQVEPTVLFVVDGYSYGGKRFDTLDKARALAQRVAGAVAVVLVSDRPAEGASTAGIRAGVRYDDFVAPFFPAEIDFPQFPFDHPALILFSSGTTGAPKCILHSAGGALLENLKAHVLHFDVRPGDRLFWWTSSGWVVWNLMTIGLAAGATLLLYDGSPFHPSPSVLWDIAERERVTFLRLTPKYIETIAKAGVHPRRTHDLSALRCITAGGAPFGASGFAYVYEKVKPDVQLASPAGGTDPLAALVSGHPIGPVWPGEIQCAALGIRVEIYGEDGRPVAAGPGELVCTQAFPSMPIGLLDDPDGARLRNSYFARFPNAWAQGDWPEFTPHGGVVIYGRSDATLKVRGVRIGTAEIYRQIERLPEIADSAAVAWNGNGDGDERIVLFVQPAAGAVLDEALATTIRTTLRDHASPRHVPDLIVSVADLPRTTTGKVSEVGVRAALHGATVANRDALANPEALAWITPACLAGAF